MLQNSFYEASTCYPVTKATRTLQEKNYRPISLMERDAKLSTKHSHTKFNKTLNGIYSMTKWNSSLGCMDGSTYANQWIVTHDINRMKDKNNNHLKRYWKA